MGLFLFIFTPEISAPKHSSYSFTPAPYVFYYFLHWCPILSIIFHCFQILVAFAGIYPDGLFHVKSIHAQIITNSVSKDQFLATKLVKAYCDLGHVGDARHVFDQFSQPKPFYVMPWLVGIWEMSGTVRPMSCLK